MSGSENVLRPSADVARKKRKNRVRVVRQYGKPKSSNGLKSTSGLNNEKCDAVNKMPSFENEIGNVSPNATNISH